MHDIENRHRMGWHRHARKQWRKSSKEVFGHSRRTVRTELSQADGVAPLNYSRHGCNMKDAAFSRVTRTYSSVSSRSDAVGQFGGATDMWIPITVGALSEPYETKTGLLNTTLTPTPLSGACFSFRFDTVSQPGGTAGDTDGPRVCSLVFYSV